MFYWIINLKRTKVIIISSKKWNWHNLRCILRFQRWGILQFYGEKKKNSLNEITRRILRRFYFTARAKSTPFIFLRRTITQNSNCQTKVRELILRGARQAIESIAKTCPSVYVHPQTKTLNQWSSKRCSTSIQINKIK